MKCRICNFPIMALVVMIFLMLHQSWSFAYKNYDNPPCYWEYTPGSRKVIYYRWGNWVDYEWKSAYNISATDWTSATNRVEYRYSLAADNTFNMYYRPATPEAGYTLWYCSGSAMIKIDVWINDAHDPGTLNLRRNYVGHELGHGIGLGHSTVYPSLMGPNDPNIHYLPQQDDINGVYAIFPW